MTQELSVMEAARDLAGYVERVAAQNEVFTLIRDGRAVAELRPVAVRRTLAELPTIMAGLPGLSPEEATAFEADLDAARAELNGSGPGTR